MPEVVKLAVLTFGFLAAELYHWLPVTTSKAMANDLQFGDRICNENGTCEYSGTGTEAQAIFSYYFIIPKTISLVLFGVGY